jgi:hypothetical protein
MMPTLLQGAGPAVGFALCCRQAIFAFACREIHVAKPAAQFLALRTGQHKHRPARQPCPCICTGSASHQQCCFLWEPCPSVIGHVLVVAQVHCSHTCSSCCQCILPSAVAAQAVAAAAPAAMHGGGGASSRATVAGKAHPTGCAGALPAASAARAARHIQVACMAGLRDC